MWHLQSRGCASPPPPCRVARTLVIVGELLGTSTCFYFQRRFHFPLEDGWSIAVAPDAGGRYRLEACRWSRPRRTLWSLDGADEHLAGVVRALAARDEILEGDRLL